MPEPEVKGSSEVEELRRENERLQSRIRELEEENRELRNRVAELSTQAVLARRRVEVLGKEVEYNPFSILPVKRGDIYLCPLCCLEFTVLSLGDYLGHLKWHHVDDKVREEVRRAAEQVFKKANR